MNCNHCYLGPETAAPSAVVNFCLSCREPVDKERLHHCLFEIIDAGELLPILCGNNAEEISRYHNKLSKDGREIITLHWEDELSAYQL